ncbi:MAG: SulP family inorganic anion transporter [Gallionella sp.]|nr:SulP family inorganic anion transporter [Gallionella sp.]
MNERLLRFFPFLLWWPLQFITVRSDLIAGITGALVLVPKAMAYAQLTGLPVYFGLYTAFIPAILGAMWGSSRQLATGPVAIVSLMTAAALIPMAVPFTDEYIGLALLLTLMVGVIQLGMGFLKLGTIVNFVSHPVILGFMNAAAIIIAFSQLDLLLGIPKGRSDSFLKDVWEMLNALDHTHLPTLLMSLFALALMLGLKKIKALSKPSVLIAVVVTTVLSVTIGFSHKEKSEIAMIADPSARELVSAYAVAQKQINQNKVEVTAKSVQLRAAEKAHERQQIAELRYQIDLMNLDAANLELANKERLAEMRSLVFERSASAEGTSVSLYLQGQVPADAASDGELWHIKKVENGKMSLSSGGDVVGSIPAGLPSFKLPTLSWDAFTQLFTAAVIIALVAFMECVSMAKALAVQTKQRLNPNQELVGQGIANIGGSFFQAYPATGSFTGSVINLQAGAQTGFAMVFNGLFVAVTLLFLTPYLYHLPKATLGVIILLAVTGLITPGAIKHAWKANKADGVVAITTFFVTLLAAPHLDKGIMIGAGLAILLFLHRTMKPRVARLGRYIDGTLRDANNYPDMEISELIVPVRFDGQLYFANMAYFEDAVLEAVAAKPKAKYVLVVANGINNLDASGEDIIRLINERLRDNGITLVFSGLKKQVLDVMHRTGLFEDISQRHIFPNEDLALDAICEWLGDDGKDDPLNPCRKPSKV